MNRSVPTESGVEMILAETPPRLDPQGELVGKYCSDAETAIQSATSMSKARQLAEQICRKLELECKSELVVNATRAHIQNIIQRRWGKEQ